MLLTSSSTTSDIHKLIKCQVHQCQLLVLCKWAIARVELLSRPCCIFDVLTCARCVQLCSPYTLTQGIVSCITYGPEFLPMFLQLLLHAWLCSPAVCFMGDQHSGQQWCCTCMPMHLTAPHATAPLVIAQVAVENSIIFFWSLHSGKAHADQLAVHVSTSDGSTYKHLCRGLDSPSHRLQRCVAVAHSASCILLLVAARVRNP